MKRSHKLFTSTATSVIEMGFFVLFVSTISVVLLYVLDAPGFLHTKQNDCRINNYALSAVIGMIFLFFWKKIVRRISILLKIHSRRIVRKFKK